MIHEYRVQWILILVIIDAELVSLVANTPEIVQAVGRIAKRDGRGSKEKIDTDAGGDDLESDIYALARRVANALVEAGKK